MYTTFIDDEGKPYGSCEVFYHDHDLDGFLLDPEGQPAEPGWYWRACLPGCLPDGDPEGPFKTQEEAVANAQGC
jgi:hypothetical protein